VGQLVRSDVPVFEDRIHQPGETEEEVIQPPLLITSLTTNVDFVTIAGFKPSVVETSLKERTLQKK
jgi:hypothetical protein